MRFGVILQASVAISKDQSTFKTYFAGRMEREMKTQSRARILFNPGRPDLIYAAILAAIILMGLMARATGLLPIQ
jgi:hypothetical protein